MKIIHFVLIFIGAIVLSYFGMMSTIPASAKQIETSTVVYTPTVPPNQADCPPGLPIGWGTYTPSPLWLLECEHCISTPTPQDTAVPTLDGTAFPTEFSGTATAQFLTGTPTPTITVTPTPGNNCQVTLNGNLSFELVPVNFISVAQITSNEYSCIDEGGYVRCVFGLGFLDEVANQDDRLKISIPIWIPQGKDTYIKTYVDPGNSCGWTEQTFINNHFISGVDVNAVGGSTGFSYDENGMYFVSGSPSGEAHIVDFWVYAGCGGTGSTSFEYQIDIYNNLSCFDDEGTPTPTPSPLLPICWSVVPNDEDQFDWDLFVPDGEPNCDMGWDEFEVSTYSIPAVEICFQPTRFGVITLFGDEFEVGVYGLMAAAALFWRYFRTSS